MKTKNTSQNKKIQKAAFYGDPNIGLFGYATDKYAVMPAIGAFDSRLLKVPAIRTQVGGTNLCGIFLAGNSEGILAPWIIKDAELKKIKMTTKKTGVEIKKISSRHTALGNLILCNDMGAIVSPLLREHFHEIKECLGVKIVEGQLMGLNIPGSVCVTTNRGFVLNMHASARDLRSVKAALRVSGDVGTVNFGSGFVKSGLIANSHGVLIGAQSTGHEMGRVAEALKFV